jgi:lipopolysaccharide biosynthesis protein
MSGAYLKKVNRRLTILLAQLGQFPHDFSHQFSWAYSRRTGRTKTESPLKVLVVVHAYWPGQFTEIISRLNAITMPLSVMVTIPAGEYAVAVEELNGKISARHTVLPMHVENIGRDIGPFLKCIERLSGENWDLVIKVHTKASQDIWFKSLLRSLLQSDRRIRRHARLLKKYPGGLIVHPLFRYPGHNQPDGEPAMERLQGLLLSCGFTIPSKWFFPAGSMFAATPETLMALKEEGERIGLTRFEDENQYSQSSSAHVFERFLGIYVCAMGPGLLGTSLLDFFDLKALLVKMI